MKRKRNNKCTISVLSKKKKLLRMNNSNTFKLHVSQIESGAVFVMLRCRCYCCRRCCCCAVEASGVSAASAAASAASASAASEHRKGEPERAPLHHPGHHAVGHHVRQQSLRDVKLPAHGREREVGGEERSDGGGGGRCRCSGRRGG